MKVAERKPEGKILARIMDANLQEQAMSALRSRSKKLEVRDFPWGCVYTATGPVLVAAGIVKAGGLPPASVDRAVTIKGRHAVIARLHKSNRFEVFVHFGPDDLIALSAEVETARREVDRIVQQLARVYSTIMPRPLSGKLGFRVE